VLPGCHTANIAPAGSVNWANRPSAITSAGSARTVPPAFVTASAVASASEVLKYSVQDGAASCSVSGPAAATAVPPCVNIP
jgi:hypothetical protein